MVNKGISLKGQAAIVTGGGAGIGRAICIALAAHGAKVLVADMSMQDAEQTAETICAAGGQAAVIGFTRALAMELKDTGIRVNCFCPGSVMSEMTMREAQAVYELDGIEPEQSLRDWQAAIPLGRWVTPEDVADIAVFLASEYAEDMTSQAINISGGQTMN